MKIKNNLSIILSSMLLSIISACGSGSTNNTPENNSNSTNVIHVDTNQQKDTPLSLKIKSLKENGFSTNNCFVLQPISQGKNYKVDLTTNQWYSTLQLSYTIKNNCDTAQNGDIVALLKGFKINNTNNTITPSYTNQTGNPWYSNIYTTQLDQNNDYSITMLAPSCTGNYCDWTKIPANSTKTFSLTYSINGPISNYSIDSLSLDNNPIPPIVESGKINLNLDTSNIQDICNQNHCNFIINYSSNGFESSINYDNKTNKYMIEGLNVGKYKFSITNLESNISVELNPSIVDVSPNNTSNETILFKKTQPSTISLTIKLKDIDDKDITTSLKPILQLIDDTNSKYNNNCIINIGNSCTFNNINPGDNYHINLQGVANASAGNYYTYNIESFVLNNSTTKEISYNKLTNNLQSVTFNVNGLESNADKPNVIFTENDDINNFIYTKNQLNSGTYTFVIGHNIAINPTDTPNNYTFESVTPNLIYVNDNQQQVVVTYSKNSPTPPTPPKVHKVYSIFWCGFSGNFCGQSNNTKDDVYNSATNVILAFGNSNPDGSISIDTDNMPTTLIQKWHNDKKNVLISIGGQNGNWQNIFNNFDNFTNSIITIIKDNNLDGVDLDIEAYNTDPEQIATDINTLRAKLNNSFLNQHKLIIISPEDVTVSKENIKPTAGQAWNYMMPTINNAIDSIDYIQPQFYNNNGESSSDNGTHLYIEKMYKIWVENNDYVTNYHYKGIPQEKLIIGLLSSTNASLQGNIYYIKPSEIEIAFNNLTNQGYNIGGFMIWDSHWDTTNQDGAYAVSTEITKLLFKE